MARSNWRVMVPTSRRHRNGILLQLRFPHPTRSTRSSGVPCNSLRKKSGGAIWRTPAATTGSSAGSSKNCCAPSARPHSSWNNPWPSLWPPSSSRSAKGPASCCPLSLFIPGRSRVGALHSGQRLFGRDSAMSDVTRILSAIDQGDAQAAEQLLPLVYDELRKLAAQKLAHEAPGQTLQATALVHEAYLRLVMPASGSRDPPGEQHWHGRRHFFAAA